jgi:alpha-tubulin suppressor-like RCC1 family protein
MTCSTAETTGFGGAVVGAVTEAGNLTFAHLSAGNAHTCGVTVGGNAYCWGDNFSGQLGDGSTQQRLAPTAVDLRLEPASF